MSALIRPDNLPKAEQLKTLRYACLFTFPQVVAPEDIQQFFEELQSRKRRRTNVSQYYCS